MKIEAAFLARLHRSRRRWRQDIDAVAAIEFSLIAPAMLMFLAIAVLAGQGFELQRKVTLTMRTLTDLVTQQTDVSSTSGAYTTNQVLKAASLVVAPYDPTQAQMVISEVLVTGASTATVQWSSAWGGAAALTTGATVTIPTKAAAAGSYLVLGSVSYDYSPLQLFWRQGAITLSNAIYMAPRNSGGIKCCGAATTGCC